MKASRSLTRSPEISLRKGNICVSIGEEIVFERPRNEETERIAIDIYTYHRLSQAGYFCAKAQKKADVAREAIV